MDERRGGDDEIRRLRCLRLSQVRRPVVRKNCCGSCNFGNLRHRPFLPPSARVPPAAARSARKPQNRPLGIPFRLLTAKQAIDPRIYSLERWLVWRKHPESCVPMLPR